jgi:putative PIN family toxin of toxin-antitoxin system
MFIYHLYCLRVRPAKLTIFVESSDVFISDFIIDEVSDKLQHKFSLSAKAVKDILNSISAVVENIKPTTSLPNVCRDKDDNHILQLCETVSADFLITGDKDLLVLENYKSTSIISPAEFMKLF